MAPMLRHLVPPPQTLPSLAEAAAWRGKAERGCSTGRGGREVPDSPLAGKTQPGSQGVSGHGSRSHWDPPSPFSPPPATERGPL